MGRPANPPAWKTDPIHARVPRHLVERVRRYLSRRFGEYAPTLSAYVASAIERDLDRREQEEADREAERLTRSHEAHVIQVARRRQKAEGQ